MNIWILVELSTFSGENSDCNQVLQSSYGLIEILSVDDVTFMKLGEIIWKANV